MRKLLFVLAAFGLYSVNAFATDYDCGLEPGTVTCSLSADGKSMTVSGNGEIKGYENNESRPWLKTVESVVIEEGVTAVGQRAFKGATKLTSVVMPGVTRLDNSAFNGTKLVNVDMPSVTTIGQSAFENVTTLQSVNIPEVTSIGEKSFYKASGLTEIDMPKVESVGTGAFQEATGLVSVDAPNLESVGNNAFKKCSSLESVNMPSLTTIGKEGFADTTSLTEINLENVQYLGQWGFRASGLISVDMPNLQEIYGSAFENSPNLAYASFPADVTIGGGRIFYGTPVGSSLYYIEDGNRVYGTCSGYIMSGVGCVSSCGEDYRPENGRCVPNPCGENEVLYEDECIEEYPFAKKHYTPAEAGKWIKGENNKITITFKK